MEGFGEAPPARFLRNGTSKIVVIEELVKGQVFALGGTITEPFTEFL